MAGKPKLTDITITKVWETVCELCDGMVIDAPRKYETLTVEQRVANGVRLLDEKRPDWEQSIDVLGLNLRSTCRCVLGQLYGDYSTAPADLKWAGTNVLDENYAASDNGFDAYDGDDLADFEALTAEWRKVIAARRAATS